MTMDRQQIQLEAIRAWKDANKVGTIVLPTGVGKSFIGCTIAVKYISNKIIKNALIVVPTVHLIDHWKKELDKHYPGYSDLIDFACVKSAYKFDKSYDLLIVDEIHASLGKEYRKLYIGIKYRMLLGLTATKPENEDYLKFLLTVCPIVYTKTMDEVLEANAVSEYKMYNLEVTFNRKDRGRYQIFDTQFKKAQFELTFLRKKHRMLRDFNTFDLANKYSKVKDVQATIQFLKSSADYTGDKYKEYEVLIEDIPSLIKYSKQYWSGMSMRKWVCYESQSKLAVVLELLTKFPDRKWIIFNKSIKYAEQLKAMIPDALIYHSKQKEDVRNKILQDFKLDKHKVLIAVDALDAGLDIPEANAAISVAGVSTQLSGTQRLGRVLRLYPGKTALFINLYTKDSQEHKWVENRTASFKNCTWVSTIAQIKG